MSKARFVFSALVFALAGMVVVFVAVGYLLADHWHVESKRLIRAAPERIAAMVSDLATWPDWTTMDVSLGPQTDRQLSGRPHEVGHAVKWSGARGAATLTVVAFTAEALDYDFHGVDPQGQPLVWSAKGRIEWHPQPDGACEVRWQENGQVDTLPGRWFSWFGATQLQAQRIQVTSLEGLAEALDRAAK